ncbi:hypothetical protein Chro_3683 [Chroococcidiopsis thermalis PCC 7203]|uniref:Uncharacterized protein n=2 Tax=Chroococcidiopsidaceae TaxID=1890528 RepID=K9U4E8_CHRTP|nr:hypothetical protein Chro_3683 [Chroococcidiopsis thermalis PCC 7203]
MFASIHSIYTENCSAIQCFEKVEIVEKLKPRAGEKNMLRTLKNVALLVAGTISLVVGIVGVILPILPGTPFLILAFFCFATLLESILESMFIAAWF